MELVLTIDESVPDYVREWVGHEVTELVAQIRRAVRQGDLKPGDPLPSVRQLANDLDIDEKIVAKAYSLLEGESIVRCGRLARGRQEARHRELIASLLV